MADAAARDRVHIEGVAVEIMILCLRPLPAANGGWNSAKWRTPKLAAPVGMRPTPVGDWLAQLPPATRSELKDIAGAPFSAGLRLEGPATAFDVAIAYAGVVAEACAGVVVLGDEVISDRRASELVWSGPQIEERWRTIDAEAARSEPGYQPVRDLTDDHRPTQTFAFPIVLEGLELTAPMARGTHDAMAGRAPAVPVASATSATITTDGPTASSAEIPAAVPSALTNSDNEPTAPASVGDEDLASAAAAAASAAIVTAVMAPAPTVPVQMTIPVQAMKDRQATGERRSVQMPAQSEDSAGHGEASASGEDEWSDVMPD